MIIYQEDIVNKHQTIWISERLLFVIDASESYLRKKRSQYKKSLSNYYKAQLKSGKLETLPETGASWRWSRMNGQFYYDYNSIPDRAPRNYKSKLPSQSELQNQINSNKASLSQQIKDEFISALEQEKDKHIDNNDIQDLVFKHKFLTYEKAEQIVNARACCISINKYSTNYKPHGINTTKRFFEISTSWVASKKLNGLKVSTPDSLRNKLRDWPTESKEEQFSYLISGKYGNQNKRVVGKHQYFDINTGELFQFDLHEAVIYSLWMNPGKPNKLHQTGNSGVFKRYEEKIQSYNLDAVSPRTVQFYINKFSNKSMMRLERDGADKFNDNVLPYIPQFIPKHTGSLWVADFSGTKLLYRDVVPKWNTNTGKKVTKQVVKSLYMCRIHDVATGDIVGWSASERQGERWEDVVPALKMAYETNHGHMAMELITDNGTVWKMKENRLKLNIMFKKHRPIGLGNKQSNKAEFYVKMLSDMAREFENWSMLGFNAQGDDNNANPDYMDASKLPTKDEAMNQIEHLVNKWKEEIRPNGTIPAEAQSDVSRLHPKLKPLDDRTLRFCLGNETSKKLDRSRGIIQLDKLVNGYRESNRFAIPDWETSMKAIDDALYGSTDVKVSIFYDENAADIYTPDGKYILTADRAELSHPTEFESTEESRIAYSRYMQSKARTRKAAESFTKNVQEVLVSADSEAVERELNYTQRAVLNGGKAKDENIKISNQKMNKDFDFDDFDENEFINNQL